MRRNFAERNMSFAETNIFYAGIYQAMGLGFIASSFLLWVGMRVTSVLVERETDNLVAKALAVIFGIAVSLNYITISANFTLQLKNHAYSMKQFAANGVDLPATSLEFIEQMGIANSVPEFSLLGNPLQLVIGLVALAFCIMPLFVPIKSNNS